MFLPAGPQRADVAVKGERIVAIAEREAMSESEIRLHLALSEAEAATRARQPAAS